MGYMVHQWRAPSTGFGKRYAFGLATALALSLIALEWTTRGQRPENGYCDLPTDLPLEPMLMVRVASEKPMASAPAPKPKKKTSGPIAIVDDVHPEPSDDADAQDDDTAPLHPLSDPIPVESNDPGPIIATTPAPPTMHPEIRPYYTRCTGSREEIDACTEAKIKRHIEKHISIPFTQKGVVATTVTFEIDADGSIGKIHCAPKVPQEIENEIRRVIGILPEFIPGTQGGHAVPVYYQIPLVMRRA